MCPNCPGGGVRVRTIRRASGGLNDGEMEVVDVDCLDLINKETKNG